ncbi:hypothetical protein N311_05958, partial [Apaloderma vittatum]
HSYSAMSSSGKDTSASSCLSSQCFDLLTKSCVKCDLFNDNTTLPLLILPASCPTAEPTSDLPSADLPSTLLIFGVLMVVGLILALGVFLACKVGKQRRKRKVAKANTDITSPLRSPGCQDPDMLERDATLALASCPRLNGGLKTPGPPGKVGEKWRPCCRDDTDGDIVLLSTMYPRHEERDHVFPLPATELGATALVTTKTTQNCIAEETV